MLTAFFSLGAALAHTVVCSDAEGYGNKLPFSIVYTPYSPVSGTT